MGGDLEQVGVLPGELAGRQRTDMHNADHPAASYHRHAHEGADPLPHQDRVQHRGVIHVVEDHRPVLSGNPPSEPPPHRDPHTLPYLPLHAHRPPPPPLPPSTT